MKGGSRGGTRTRCLPSPLPRGMSVIARKPAAPPYCLVTTSKKPSKPSLLNRLKSGIKKIVTMGGKKKAAEHSKPAAKHEPKSEAKHEPKKHTGTHAPGPRPHSDRKPAPRHERSEGGRHE